jgi:uncharacterized cofD-like protein
MKKKKIVVIGGGNGSAIVLVSLKKYIAKYDITAAISMADSGGSSGRLRHELSTLPPGDIMRAVLALSVYDYSTLRKIFYAPRFKKVGRLDSHNFGNLFLTLCTKYCGDFLAALDAFSQSIQAQGKVYPVTLSQVDLVAELDNGELVHTEEFIDTPNYNRGWKIKKVWLKPKAEGFPPALKAIKSADYIILSPGSLYTSLVATLLPGGVKLAIKNSKAKIIYVAGNAFRTDGETGPERLSDFVLQLEKYLPRSLDVVVYNNHKPQGSQEKKFYKEKKWGLVEFDEENLMNREIVSKDLERSGGGMCDVKLGKLLKTILK